MKGIGKYKIGLAVLGVLILGLLVFVVVQANAYKTDKDVAEVADKIAEDLNDYISDKNEIPENLSDATDEDVPEQISYEKRDDSYEICVTYNDDVDYYSSLSSFDLTSVLYRGLSANANSNFEYESDYKSSYLYFSYTDRKKGENCKEIEPRISTYQYNSGSNNYQYSGSGSSGQQYDYNFVCEEDYEYYEYYKDYCVDGEYIYN